MTDFIFDKVVEPTIWLVTALVIISIPFGVRYSMKSTDELQTILKNECGMEYSISEVRRNGENLSRICGQKNN